MAINVERAKEFSEIQETSVYLSGWVVSSDYFYVLAERNVGHKYDPWSYLPPVRLIGYRLEEGMIGKAMWPKNNFKYPKIVPIQKKELLIVDNNTQVYQFGDKENRFWEEDIPIIMAVKGARNIHGTIYAVGTARTVMRREGVNKWVQINTDAMRNQVLEQKTGKGPTHFGAIDGFASDHDLYAGGDHSDFWHYDGKTWRAIDIPLTMMHINDICCTERGDVVAVGRFGAIIVGREDSWVVVDTTGFTAFDIKSVVSFQGRVFIASEYDLFELTEDNRLVLVDFNNQPRPRSFGHLTTNAGWMMSTGSHTAALFDGKDWQILHQIGKGAEDVE